MNHNKKFMLAAALLALLLTVAVGGTLAYLVDTTDEVKNVFTPSSVPPSIEETFDGKVKSDVAIKNNGNIDAYIRAAVVITWQDEAGNVLAQKPNVDAGDYSITYDKDNWVKSADGFWYYTLPVKANGTTTNLITECKPLKAAPQEGFTLHVEILAQTIQAEPTDVVESVWKSGVSDADTTTGKLTIK